MQLTDFHKLDFPDVPGVYFFKNGAGETLYIGKATSLRDRVRSYFADDLMKTRGRLLVDMIAQASTVTYRITDSVLEAFILETQLIKDNQPKYNTKEKDNKSFNYVIFTKEDFPRVLVVRGRNLQLAGKTSEQQIEALGYEYTDVFGPYPFGAELKEALRIIRRIFPYRDKCAPYSGPAIIKKKAELDASGSRVVKSNEGFGKPCFNRTIGLCPGVCTGEMTKTHYAKRISDLRLFFQGQKDKVMDDLEKRMNQHAKHMEFELANEVKKTLYALSHIRDVSMIKRGTEFGALADEADRVGSATAAGSANANADGIISAKSGARVEAYDVAHMSGKSVVGAMVVLEDGEFNKNEYRKFNIKTAKGGDDFSSLTEMLKRRFNHPEWTLPQAIVIDGGKTHIVHAKKVLLEIFTEQGRPKELDFIEVVSIVKDSSHKAREVLRSTAFAARGAGDSGNGPAKASVLTNEEAVQINAECHRFALKSHKILRSKNMFR
ncbi:MAG TPA: GIY-YIG nuclease family protein [Candidatus Paceibacterota bacterium]